jgi:NitT/TauT family transport system substrate-binding protein
MKKNIFLIFLFFSLLSFTSCQTTTPSNSKAGINQPDDNPIVLLNPLGPLVIPVSGITSNQVKGNIQIEIQNWNTVDEVTGLIAGEGTPFVVLPITTAANFDANGIPLVLLGVHEWKVFYLIASEDADFSDWNSLVGKTIYTPEGKGQTVDTLTRFALTKSGITPDKDVEFVYAPAQEIVALFKEGKVDYAALPEPFVSLALAGGDGDVVVDYQEYWSQVSGTTNGIPIAGLFVKYDFYEKHPEITAEIASTFADSINWANENPDAAIEASSSVLTIPEKIIKSALDRMKFEYIPASQSKQEVLEFLITMQATYPDGIKTIPSDDFFAN